MPGLIGINVGGYQMVRPGVGTEINTSAMVPAAQPAADICAACGPADGGIPGKVYEFTSYAQAAAVLRGGASLSYLSRIFVPSPDLPGASKVRFVRVVDNGSNKTTQATLTAAGIIFTSLDFGRYTNGITVQIAAGAVAPWTVTIRNRADNTSRSYNAGAGLSVKSTATTPKIVFDHATRLVTLTENAVTVASLTYPNDGVTIASLVAWINGRAGWTAQLAAGADPSMPVSYMDNPAGGTAIATTFTAVTAGQGSLIWVLNAQDSLVSAALASGSTFAALSTVAETSLSGGLGTSLDVLASSDWQVALDVLAGVDAQALFAATTDSTVQGLAYQHVLAARTQQRKRYRIYYTGGAKGETASAAQAAAPVLAGPVVYCWNGTATINPVTGAVENLGGLGLAAQVCGMACGSYAAEPLTNKSVISYGLDVANPTDATIDACLIAGVTPAAVDVTTGRTIVVQALTTWQGGTNVSFRKLQGLRIQDALQRLFQAALTPFIGYPLDLQTGQMIHAAVAKALDASTKTAQNPGGFLTPGRVNGQPVPAWSNLSITTDGLESWTIAVEAHPVGETDYIKVVVNLTPAPISL